MAFTLPAANERNYENAPVGQYVCVCTQLIDLGTQPQSYLGQPKAPARQVRFVFELHATDDQEQPIVMADGRQFTISSYDMTVNTGDKANFRKFLENWRGRAFTEKEIGPGGTFDLTKTVGAYGMASVVSYTKKDKTEGTGLGTVTPLFKGIAKPRAKNPLICFSMTPGDFNAEHLASLSANVVAKIKASPEWAEMNKVDPQGQSGHDEGFNEIENAVDQAANQQAQGRQQASQNGQQRPTASAQQRPAQTTQQQHGYQQRTAGNAATGMNTGHRTMTSQQIDDEIPF